MKVLIIGAGRMGQRHAQGVAPISDVETIVLTDISDAALLSAEEILSSNSNHKKFLYQKTEEFNDEDQFDIGIISATAQGRLALCELAVKTKCKYVLVEKPIGQSVSEVEELIRYFKRKETRAFVNLNMRLYPDSLKLKNDLNSKPQLKGIKNITINTGTVGIAANGIHYLDYLFFLTDADDARIISAEINDTTIPSARGQQFKDFGGWCILKLYKKKNHVANVFLSISSQSTVFGGWDIVCPNGRITINECNGKRWDYIRKEESEMPIQRYNADYLPPVESTFESPFLGELTKLWVEGLMNNQFLLPDINEVEPSHRLMFEWLSYSKTYSEVFPIT